MNFWMMNPSVAVLVELPRFNFQNGYRCSQRAARLAIRCTAHRLGVGGLTTQPYTQARTHQLDEYTEKASTVICNNLRNLEFNFRISRSNYQIGRRCTQLEAGRACNPLYHAPCGRDMTQQTMRKHQLLIVHVPPCSCE